MSARVLLLDIGNSRVKWTTGCAQGLARPLARVHGGDPASVVATLRRARVDAVWVSSVVGAAHESAIVRAVRARFGLRARFARTEKVFDGLRCAYADPARMGVDRWLALIAGWSRERGAACVAMAGTALTLDAVDAKGRHLGGLIAPGLSALERGLLEAVRFRLRGKRPPPRAALGRDTESCVRAGTLFAALGALERGAAEAPPGPRFVTGGDAALLIRFLPSPWRAAPDLVLEGLWRRASQA